MSVDASATPLYVEPMSHVVTENEGAVRTLRIARPEKKNALTIAMYEQMIEVLSAADQDDSVNVLRIIGSPGVFTAGNDIFDFMQRPPTGEDSAVFRVLLGLVGFAKPIIAAVDGPAVGLGTTMLLHCDLVVATTAAKFRMPFVPLGLVPEGASSLLLPRGVGMQRASEWLMLGDAFSAEDAYRAGLVNRLVEPSALEAESMKLATELAARPKEAVRLTKKLIRDPLRESTLATLKREGALFVQRLQSPEAMAAFMAFAQKK